MKQKTNKVSATEPYFYKLRHYFVLFMLIMMLLSLIGRAFYLQLVEQTHLTSEASQRQIRTIKTAAYRGTISDRRGTPLAISTPVDSIWANPQQSLANLPALRLLTKKLNLNYADTLTLLKQKANREFVYLKRHVNPDLALQVANGEAGIYLQREYRRYYPAGEVVSHLVGFTNIDGEGLEGLEREHNESLKALAGKRQIVRNRKGEVVEEIKQIVNALPGENLQISIDMRLQYITYRSLARAIQYHAAKSGSAVLLDAKTSEVLALVNLPSYNPNQRKKQKQSQMRNLALTDVFEPGSAIKPFTLAAALDTKRFNEKTQINTSPGYFKVSGHAIKDFKDYGELDLAGILRKSSNVGASKIAMSLSSKELWQAFSNYGFGELSGVKFPGESAGYFSHYSRWQDLDHATMAFGYGLSVSVVQLAKAYMLFANGGLSKDISLIRGASLAPPVRVMRAETAKSVLSMLEQVVGDGGTATRAAVPGFRIAGKTGTARKSSVGGYTEDKYIAVFAGIAPASDPRLVMAVMVNEPTQNGYYGGLVAAPVFQKVIEHALRLMDIAPDDLPSLQVKESKV